MTDNISSGPVIGVGVLVWRDKQVLLGERLDESGTNCWQFPGGHLENNESVITCARREVMEETGLIIKNLRHLGFTDQQFEVAQKQYITLLVSCEHDSGEAETREPDKCAGWRWFDYRELPSPLFIPISNFLLQINNRPAAVTERSDLYALHRSSQVFSDAPSGVRR